MILFCVQIINGWMIVVDVAKPLPPRYNQGRARPSAWQEKEVCKVLTITSSVEWTQFPWEAYFSVVLLR